MPSLDKISEYAALVSQQIRWKKARLRVSEEITNHIVDGRDSYIAQGLDEETSTDKAIADTGDSMIIGTQLDRIHRPKPQWVMFAWVAGFVHFAIIGIVLLIVAVIKNWFGINRAIGVMLTIIPHVIFFAVIFAQGSFRSARLMAIINPHSDPLGHGFFAIQARELLSNAVLVGEGTMPDFFPQALLYSDFILSTIIIRFGWLAFAVVMSALLLFMGKVIVRCMKQKSGLGFYAFGFPNWRFRY